MQVGSAELRLVQGPPEDGRGRSKDQGFFLAFCHLLTILYLTNLNLRLVP